LFCVAVELLDGFCFSIAISTSWAGLDTVMVGGANASHR
jgi:hypothetical protein